VEEPARSAQWQRLKQFQKPAPSALVGWHQRHWRGSEDVFLSFFLQVTKNNDKTHYLMSGSSSVPIRPCPGSLCPRLEKELQTSLRLATMGKAESEV
ncbi:hypothetical protein LEMLEM_LOCUS9166, partial [Lemmus lemmus]